MKILFPILLGALVLATHAKGESFNHPPMNFADMNLIVMQNPDCPLDELKRLEADQSKFDKVDEHCKEIYKKLKDKN